MPYLFAGYHFSNYYVIQYFIGT